VTAKRKLPREQLIGFLAEMLLIRRFEEKVTERFRAGELRRLPARLHRPGGGRGRRLSRAR
jgi:TPP-dependent pyruvate/acetoin dehydrogenase alpha subunit